MLLSNLIKELKKGYETRSVLIIDDDKEVVDSLAKIMTFFFKECISTIDGEQGYDIFLSRLKTNNPFSLVITDLELPKLGGLKLIQEIRKVSNLQPILILSAHDEAEFMAEAICLNVQGYLIKPLSMPKLFNSLKKIFSNKIDLNRRIYNNRDGVTGWKKGLDFINESNSIAMDNITVLRLKINHLEGMFNIVGEDFANEYLSQLALLLKGLVVETVAEFYRTDFDELTIILKGKQLENAKKIADNMVSAIRYFHISEKNIILNSTLSIGIAYGKEDAFITSRLALNNINNGIDGVNIFNEIEHNKNITSDKYDILKMLFNAIKEENITPVFQPIVDVKSGKIKIFQSLIRIREGGHLFGPKIFLQLSMDMGQMIILTKLMIRSTLESLQKLPKEVLVSISLSSYDFEDDSLMTYIDFWMERKAVCSKNIAFQIEDSLDEVKSKKVLESILKLKEKGFKIILNSYGLSKFNLSNIFLIKPDFIKLQEDTVDRIEVDNKALLVIQKIIDIANILGSEVIISHISDRNQIDLIKSCHINLMQGFAISPPFEVDYNE